MEFIIDLAMVVAMSKYMKLPIAKSAQHAPNRKPLTTIMYCRVNAHRYPFGFFQSNGYLQFGCGNHLFVQHIWSSKGNQSFLTTWPVAIEMHFVPSRF